MTIASMDKIQNAPVLRNWDVSTKMVGANLQYTIVGYTDNDEYILASNVTISRNGSCYLFGVGHGAYHTYYKAYLKDRRNE